MKYKMIMGNNTYSKTDGFKHWNEQEVELIPITDNEQKDPYVCTSCLKQVSPLDDTHECKPPADDLAERFAECDEGCHPSHSGTLN